MPQAQPELKKYMEKRVFCQLNGDRKVIGVLRGYDVFMNLVLDESFEEKAGGEKAAIGMVVRPDISGKYICVCGNFAKGKIYQVIRGNSIVMLEALERINEK